MEILPSSPPTLEPVQWPYVEALPARGRLDPDPSKAPHHRQEGAQDKVCRVYEEHGTLARLAAPLLVDIFAAIDDSPPATRMPPAQRRRGRSGFNEFLGKRWPCNAEEELETHGYPKGQ